MNVRVEATDHCLQILFGLEHLIFIRSVWIMILYHYCSPEAFLNIIQGRKIWLSNSQNMSDYLEGSWIVGIINETLSELISTYSQDAINKVANTYNISKFSPYICCFSEDGDLLSQWRGYASDGHGFAIGFDSKLFPLRKEMPKMANWGDKNKEKLYLPKIARIVLSDVPFFGPNITS